MVRAGHGDASPFNRHLLEDPSSVGDLGYPEFVDLVTKEARTYIKDTYDPTNYR